MTKHKPIEQYMALALQTMIRGAQKREDIQTNINHISELAHAAYWLTNIDLPVRLLTLPEGALQGFTDEIFDWDHEDYVNRMAIDIPGKETDALGVHRVLPDLTATGVGENGQRQPHEESGDEHDPEREHETDQAGEQTGCIDSGRHRDNAS